MKAVLVIDMPSNCSECPCCYENDGFFKEYSCQAMGFKKVELLEKPSWCPLRPLPREWTMDEVEPCAYNEGFVDGLNHCIYLITGEIKKEAE